MNIVTHSWNVIYHKMNFSLNLPYGVTDGKSSSPWWEMRPRKCNNNQRKNLAVAEQCCFVDFVPAIATCVHWIALRTNTLKGKMELEWQLYIQTTVTRRSAWRSFEVRNSRRFSHSKYVFASTIRAIHFEISFHFRTKIRQLKVTKSELNSQQVNEESEIYFSCSGQPISSYTANKSVE